MKRLYIFLFLGFILSCKNEKRDPAIPAGGLYEIQLDGNLHNKVEYNRGKISRFSTYMVCGKAYQVLDIRYSADLVSSIRSGMRKFWFSWGEDCNTEKPFEYSDYQFEYDNDGRYKKITGNNYEAIYEYTGDQATLRILYKNGGQPRTIYLKYDPQGNMIEERNADNDNVGLIRYEYDRNPNPLKGLNNFGLPDPFYSTNNALRAVDGNGELIWERKYTYDSDGRPLTCVEGSGASFKYLYR